MLHGIVHADHMDTILRQLVDAARVVGGSLETFREQVVVSELVGTVVDSLGRDPIIHRSSGSATTRPCSSIPRG